MPDDFEGSTLPSTRVELADGFELAECIGTDGDATIWLLSPDGDAGHGNAGPAAAPHEQEGALPRDYRRRLGLTCGAPTRSKRPCGALVRTFGAHCGHHQGEELDPSAEPGNAHDEGRLF